MVYVMILRRTAADINKGRTLARRTCKSGPPMRCGGPPDRTVDPLHARCSRQGSLYFWVVGIGASSRGFPKTEGALPHRKRYPTKVVASNKMLPKSRRRRMVSPAPPSNSTLSGSKPRSYFIPSVPCSARCCSRRVAVDQSGGQQSDPAGWRCRDTGVRPAYPPASADRTPADRAPASPELRPPFLIAA